MTLNPVRTLAASGLVLLFLWWSAAAGWVRPALAGGWVPARAPWELLLFEGSSWGGHVSAQVELGSPTQQDPGLGEADGSRGPVLLPEQREVLVLRTAIDATVLGKHQRWTGRVWFLAEHGTALQRIRFKGGKEGSFKQFRYGRDGVYRKRVEPKGRAEASLPPAQWSKVKESFYPYAAGGADCEPVLDPLILIYVLSAADWSAQGEREFCVFNKQNLYLVRLKNEGMERLQTGFLEQREAPARALEREVDVWKIRLTSRPLDPGSKDLDPFEFLGFEGDVRILLEAQSGLPLHLTGEIPKVGEVELKLTKAALAP